MVKRLRTPDKTPERKVFSYEKKPIAKIGREILVLCNQIAATATAWKYNDVLYYTSGVSNHTAGVNEPVVGDTIYSDSACTTAVTTISAIA